jgi:hypothetical protein
MVVTSCQESPQAIRGRIRNAERILKLYRQQVSRLCRIRYRTHFLSDTEAGRALIVAMLRVKVGTDAIAEAAPWLEPAELKPLQRDARNTDLHAIGNLVRLSNLRNALHLALDKLEERGLIETRMEYGIRGLVRCARKARLTKLPPIERLASKPRNRPKTKVG